MPTLTNPSEIAREAFRLLASRRMSPSPENYQALYHEIAGISAAAATPFPERELKALLNALPKRKAGTAALAEAFRAGLQGQDLGELKRGLGELFAQLGKEQELPWSELFGDFLRQWEGKQAGLTVARKREAFERLLAAPLATASCFSHACRACSARGR
jgi:diguanylate cyclase